MGDVICTVLLLLLWLVFGESGDGGGVGSIKRRITRCCKDDNDADAYVK